MDSMKTPGKLQELSLEFTWTPDGVHKDAWLSVTISTSRLSKSLRGTYCFQTLYRILMVVHYICEYSMLAISRAFISHTEWANNVLIWLCKDVHLMFIFSRTTKQLILRLKIKTKQSVMT